MAGTTLAENGILAAQPTGEEIVRVFASASDAARTAHEEGMARIAEGNVLKRQNPD